MDAPALAYKSVAPCCRAVCCLHRQKFKGGNNPRNCAFPGGSIGLMRGSLGPPESTTQTVSRSVQPFWSTRSKVSNGQTDHATTVATGHSLCTQCSLIIYTQRLKQHSLGVGVSNKQIRFPIEIVECQLIRLTDECWLTVAKSWFGNSNGWAFKVQRELPLFWTYPKFLITRCRIGERKPTCQNKVWFVQSFWYNTGLWHNMHTAPA